MFRLSSSLTQNAALVIGLVSLNACSWELRKVDDDSDNGGTTTYSESPYSDGKVAECLSCSGETFSVPILVQYALTENLGERRTLHVEAFANQGFQGTPASQVESSDFD